MRLKTPQGKELTNIPPNIIIEILKVENMSEEMQRTIEEIYRRGNTVEIKQRKDDIIVLEVVKKIVYKCDRQNGAC